MASNSSSSRPAKNSVSPGRPDYSGSLPNNVWWQVYHDDARQGLRRLEEGSVQCVVTSPPYYWQRDYGVRGQIGHEPQVQGYVDALVDCFHEVRRVLRDDGVVFLNLGDTFYSAKGKPHGRDRKNGARQLSRRELRAVDGPGLGLPRKSMIGIPWRVALALQGDGWVLRSDIIWRRPDALPEPTARDRPHLKHEYVFLLAKRPRYYFNRGPLPDSEDVWKISARPDRPGSHFAAFPSALVERCVACGCPRGSTVLDPFAGSGTTLYTAAQMERNAVGIELNEDYCLHIKERFSNLEIQRPLALGVSGRTRKRLR